MRASHVAAARQQACLTSGRMTKSQLALLHSAIPEYCPASDSRSELSAFLREWFPTPCPCGGKTPQRNAGPGVGHLLRVLAMEEREGEIHSGGRKDQIETFVHYPSPPGPDLSPKSGARRPERYVRLT